MTDFEELHTKLEMLLEMAKSKDNGTAEITFSTARVIVSACMKLELHVTALENRIDELERVQRYKELMYGA